jgi:hypothetical protein
MSQIDSGPKNGDRASARKQLDKLLFFGPNYAKCAGLPHADPEPTTNCDERDPTELELHTKPLIPSHSFGAGNCRERLGGILKCYHRRAA